MKTAAEVLAVCVLGGLAFAANGHATVVKVTDPRQCNFGPTHRDQCSRAAAKLVARRLLARRAGLPYIWQGDMTCTSAGTLLRWRCWFGAQFPQLPPKGYVAVTYRATSTGWHVYTTIVATP